MANTNAPFGFIPIRRQDGAAWTGNQTVRKIAYNNATAIYRGDVVKVLDTGYIAQGDAGNSAHTNLAIFAGCKYISSANNNPILSPYWPGSGNLGTADVEAYVIDDPNVVFEVQASGAAITFAEIGQNADFVVGTGNTRTGISGMTLNSSTGTTATYPFRVLGLVSGVGPGTDAASSYNRVEVMWNDQFYRQTSGL